MYIEHCTLYNDPYFHFRIFCVQWVQDYPFKRIPLVPARGYTSRAWLSYAPHAPTQIRERVTHCLVYYLDSRAIVILFKL